MEFDKVVNERYSVRDFKPERLTEAEVEKILNAGHIAPTGCNKQPQRILVLNSDTAMEKLARCTRCCFNAPTAFLVCYNRDESWKRVFDGALSAPVDADIVATHMMLKASEMGMGSCWVMYFDPATMRKEFNIPENIIPQALLIMGHPSDAAAPGPMHAEYRPIEEVVTYESF